MRSLRYLAEPPDQLTDPTKHLLTYSPNEVGRRDTFWDDRLLTASPWELHGSLFKVIAATHAALRLFHRQSPISAHDLSPLSHTSSKAYRHSSPTVLEEIRRIDAPVLHTNLLRYHPLLVAIRFEPLRDDLGREIPKDQIDRMSLDEHARAFNRKLDDIRHRARHGKRQGTADLRKQAKEFRQVALKNHASVVGYVDQLLAHYPLLKVVPLQTGYDPSPTRQAGDGEIPLTPNRIEWLLRLQDDRDALLHIRHSHPLFKGLVGYVWQQL